MPGSQALTSALSPPAQAKPRGQGAQASAPARTKRTVFPLRTSGLEVVPGGQTSSAGQIHIPSSTSVLNFNFEPKTAELVVLCCQILQPKTYFAALFEKDAFLSLES